VRSSGVERKREGKGTVLYSCRPRREEGARVRVWVGLNLVFRSYYGRGKVVRGVREGVGRGERAEGGREARMASVGGRSRRGAPRQQDGQQFSFCIDLSARHS
jgi:hypothetical protein